MAVKDIGLLSASTAVPLITLMPLSRPGSYISCKALLLLMVKLVKQGLSISSNPYTTGPAAIAVLPFIVLIESFGVISLGSTDRFNSMISPLFHSRLMDA